MCKLTNAHAGGASGPRLRVPTAVTAGIIGGMAGFLYAFQSSSGRLMVGLCKLDPGLKAPPGFKV